MLNVVALVGRLTATPELKHTSNNLSVTKFSIAVARSYSGPNKERQTDFLDVVAWRQTAEFACNYFIKGQLIAVEGSIQTRTYQDNNGVNRKVTEIIASNLHFVEPKGTSRAPLTQTVKEDSGSVSYSSGSDQDFISSEPDDDMPF